MNKYRERDLNLKSLGYSSYDDYLNSLTWRYIRDQVLIRDKARCYLCGGLAEHIHHTNYSKSVLRGDDLTPLYSLCKGCHFTVEFTKDGKKRTFQASLFRFQRMERTRGSKIGKRKGGAWIGLSYKKMYQAINQKKIREGRAKRGLSKE